MNLIIHHWDTDGICSAVIIAKLLEERGEDWMNASLLPGIFEFDERIWQLGERAKHIFVLDLNMPEQIERLKGPVIFFDHHLQKKIHKENIKQVNPTLEGSNAPSTTWVISKHYNKWSLLSALGAVGDIGVKIFDTSYRKDVKELLEKEGMTEEDALKLSGLIDTPSIIGDQRGVEDAVIRVKISVPVDLCRDSEWNTNLENINTEVERVMSELKIVNNLARIEFSSDYNICSKIARDMVWTRAHDGALVVNRSYHGYAQVYFRVNGLESSRFEVPRLMELLRDSGINVGGKEEVMGALCESERLECIIDIIEDHLRWVNG